jgi:hypothetical protein
VLLLLLLLPLSATHSLSAACKADGSRAVPKILFLLIFFMRGQKSDAPGGHSLFYRACAVVGGSYCSLLIVILMLSTIFLSIGIMVVYGGFPTPDPRAFDAEPWVWVSAANATHAAITVRLFAGSDSLFICKTAPTSASPCSTASALYTIPIPNAADGSGLFKTIVGGLLPGARYYYRVHMLPCRPTGTFIPLKFVHRSVLAPLARSSRLLLQEQASNSLPLLAHRPTRTRLSCAP